MKAKEIFFFFSRWIWCLFCSLVRWQHWDISSCNLIKTIRLWLCLGSVTGMHLGRQTILGALTVERRWGCLVSHEVWKSCILDFGKALFAKQLGRQTGTGPLTGTQGQLVSTASVRVVGVTCVRALHSNSTAHSPQCVNSIKLCLCECWHDRLGYYRDKTEVRN